MSFAPLSTTTQQVAIAITDDNVVEAVENFTAALSSATPLGGRSIDTTDGASVGIVDNDTAVFSVGDVTVNEGDGTATLTVSSSNPIDIPLAIDVAYADGSTEASDFDHVTNVANFAVIRPYRNKSRSRLRMTMLLKPWRASQRQSALRRRWQAEASTQPTRQRSASSTIDTAVFTIDDVTVNEGDATATLTVRVSNPIDIPVDVDVAYTDGSTEPTDFDHTADLASFAALSTAAQQVTIAITDDSIIEASEDFTASLSTTTVLGGRSVNTSDAAIVTILDNDNAPLAIDDVTVDEDAAIK